MAPGAEGPVGVTRFGNDAGRRRGDVGRRESTRITERLLRVVSPEPGETASRDDRPRFRGRPSGQSGVRASGGRCRVPMHRLSRRHRGDREAPREAGLRARRAQVSLRPLSGARAHDGAAVGRGLCPLPRDLRAAGDGRVPCDPGSQRIAPVPVRSLSRGAPRGADRVAAVPRPAGRAAHLWRLP